jgi:hypothetical protein
MGYTCSSCFCAPRAVLTACSVRSWVVASILTLTHAHTHTRTQPQAWYEVPFASRRNIVASMLLGTAGVWFWNKSE